MKENGMMDWSEKYKAPMTEDYQPSEREFAGEQMGKTVDYISRRDREQTDLARSVEKQNYRGRYE